MRKIENIDVLSLFLRIGYQFRGPLDGTARTFVILRS